jgi:hypothetical protein
MPTLPLSLILRSVPRRRPRFGRKRRVAAPRIRVSEDVRFFLLAWCGGFIFFFTILN